MYGSSSTIRIRSSAIPPHRFPRSMSRARPTTGIFVAPELVPKSYSLCQPMGQIYTHGAFIGKEEFSLTNSCDFRTKKFPANKAQILYGRQTEDAMQSKLRKL